MILKKCRQFTAWVCINYVFTLTLQTRTWRSLQVSPPTLRPPSLRVIPPWVSPPRFILPRVIPPRVIPPRVRCSSQIYMWIYHIPTLMCMMNLKSEVSVYLSTCTIWLYKTLINNVDPAYIFWKTDNCSLHFLLSAHIYIYLFIILWWNKYLSVKPLEALLDAEKLGV